MSKKNSKIIATQDFAIECLEKRVAELESIIEQNKQTAQAIRGRVDIVKKQITLLVWALDSVENTNFEMHAQDWAAVMHDVTKTLGAAHCIEVLTGDIVGDQ